MIRWGMAFSYFKGRSVGQPVWYQAKYRNTGGKLPAKAAKYLWYTAVDRLMKIWQQYGKYASIDRYGAKNGFIGCQRRAWWMPQGENVTLPCSRGVLPLCCYNMCRHARSRKQMSKKAGIAKWYARRRSSGAQSASARARAQAKKVTLPMASICYIV